MGSLVYSTLFSLRRMLVLLIMKINSCEIVADMRVGFYFET